LISELKWPELASSAPASGVLHLHDAEPVHDGLQRLDRVDLGYQHIGAVALGARGEAAADPAVAGDYDFLAGQQHVGRADDAVERRLAGAVPVVEHVLGVGLVDGDDRVAQHAAVGHRLQPDDAGRGLFGAADDLRDLATTLLVQHRHQVRAVIHRHRRVMVQRRVDVLVVGVVVLAANGIGLDRVLLHQRGGDRIVGGKRVGCAQSDVGAGCFQRQHQVGRLARDMQAGCQLDALQGLFLREPPADQQQHGHLTRRPVDQVLALAGQLHVLDVG